jgi:predicted AAA+ superfamily ATPase
LGSFENRKPEFPMKKTVLTETIEQLPEEFALEDLIERLILLEKIEKSRQQVREGKIHTTKEARQKVSDFFERNVRVSSC